MARALVTWSNEYNVGVEEIDNQHRSLVDLINQIWQSIVFQADREKTFELMGRLEHYTVAHFAAEEAYMEAIGYPDLEAHKEIHKQFVARIAQEKHLVESGGQLTLGLMEFLKQWLLQHIMGTDMNVGRFAQKAKETRAQSTSTEEAPESILKRIFKRFF